jgi:hypothetical protein
MPHTYETHRFTHMIVCEDEYKSIASFQIPQFMYSKQVVYSIINLPFSPSKIPLEQGYLTLFLFI